MPYGNAADLDKLGEEFTDYQLMELKEVPESILKSALVVDSDDNSQHYRMDTVWAYLSTLKGVDGLLRFPKLSKIAQLVLVIPHSNADEEQVFSMVTKNKTVFCPNLKLNGTLSSILKVKLANCGSCVTYEPSSLVLESSKKLQGSTTSLTETNQLIQCQLCIIILAIYTCIYIINSIKIVQNTEALRHFSLIYW